MNRKSLLLLGATVVALAVIVLLVGSPPPPEPSEDHERGLEDDGTSPGATGPSGEASGAEGGAVDPVEPEGPQLVVAVRDEAGRPLPAAGVIAVKDGNPVARGETDAFGEIAIPAPGGEGEVVVLPGFAPPLRQALPLEAGRVEIVLPLGAVIEGRVLVGNAPPAEPLELTAWSRVAFPGFETTVQPFGNETRTRRLRIRTDATGAFALRGLPVDWQAFLVVPMDHRLVEPEGNGKSLPVRAPTTGLLVRLRRLPVVTGRVVGADGLPSPNARVKLELLTDRGGTTLAPRTDDEGRFRVLVQTLGITKATFHWSDAGGIGSGRRELKPDRLGADLDLGDLVLPGIREIVLLVRDRDGKPVPGAWTSPAGSSRPRAGPSDGAGRVAITVAATVEALRVAALGQGSVTVPLSDTSDPIPVVLGGGNLLRIRVEGPDGDVPTGVSLSASAKPPMFDTPEGSPDPLQGASGASGVYYWSRPEGRDTGGFPLTDGVTVLSGLTAGNPIRIEVRDGLTRSVLASREVALSARESREVVIRLDRRDRPLRGRVVDPEGNPIERAIVSATVPGAGTRRTDVDAEGWYALKGVRAESVDLRVSRYGFATREFPAFEIPEGGRTFDVVLQPGRTVRVVVVDTAGTPLENLDVGAIAPGLSEPIEGFEENPGSYVLEDLPVGEAILFAHVGGRRFTRAHDTSIGEAKITLPRAGSVSVRIRFPFERRVIHRLRLVGSAKEPLEVLCDVHLDNASDRTVLVPVVFPGRYRVLLEAWKESLPSGRVYDLVEEGPEVTVRVGARSEVEIVR